MQRLLFVLVLLPSGLMAQASTVAERKAAWAQHVALRQGSPFKQLRWQAVGPRLQGGRIETIAVHPQDEKTVYVGPGSGNVWKTTNRGISWAPVFENESTFSIGSIAIAPSQPDTLYVGTGETQPRHSGYSFAGTGVFRSDDAGKTWRNLGLWGTHHIGRVVVHPKDPDTVWVAAIGPFWSRNDQRGVFKSADGGETWQKVLYVSDRTGAVDLVVDPQDPERLYAWTWQVTQGEESGLYRSVDGGDTWSRVTKGLPQASMGRAGLAIAPSRPATVYCFLDNHAPLEPPQRNRSIRGAELYRSEDHGVSWRKVNEADLYPVFSIFGWKFCDVRVVPDNPDELFILGNRVYHSTDGGKSFTRIGEKILRLHDTRGEVMHLDHHDLHIDPRDPDRLILGNDGGLFLSNDRGKTWLHVNNLPIGEFYFVSVDNAEPFRIYGGTQDNASLYGPSDATIDPFKNDPWQHVFLDIWTGGDGFVTLKDPTDDFTVYYEHQHGAMRRMDLRGPVLTRHGKGIRPRLGRNKPRPKFGWYTPFILSHDDPRTLLAGGDRIYESRDRGDSWRPISPVLADPGAGERGVVPFGTVTMLSESRLEKGLLYAGTEGGSLHRRRGDKWQRVGAGLPKKWVSRVIASRHAKDRVYVAMTGFREDDFRAYLFVSEDGGATFRSIAANLPMESVNVVREDPRDADVLYVGTDGGVFVSRDRGKQWHVLGAGLPTTPVHDLVVHARDHKVVIGTHGRSVFVLDVRSLVPN